MEPDAALLSLDASEEELMAAFFSKLEGVFVVYFTIHKRDISTLENPQE